MKSPAIIYPFEGEAFLTAWETYKKIIREEKHQRIGGYREQLLLQRIGGMAKDEAEAIEIIRQSSEGGWTRFYPVKESNGVGFSPDWKKWKTLAGQEWINYKKLALENGYRYNERWNKFEKV